MAVVIKNAFEQVQLVWPIPRLMVTYAVVTFKVDYYNELYMELPFKITQKL